MKRDGNVIAIPAVEADNGDYEEPVIQGSASSEGICFYEGYLSSGPSAAPYAINHIGSRPGWGLSCSLEFFSSINGWP